MQNISTYLFISSFIYIYYIHINKLDDEILSQIKNLPIKLIGFAFLRIVKLHPWSSASTWSKFYIAIAKFIYCQYYLTCIKLSYKKIGKLKLSEQSLKIQFTWVEIDSSHCVKLNIFELKKMLLHSTVIDAAINHI